MTFSFDALYADGVAPAQPLGGRTRGTYDFAVAYPDPASLPLDGLIDGLKDALATEGKVLALYAHPQGYEPLRQLVADRLARDRSIDVGADDIILASGSSQPIYIIAETLLNPGDLVLTEDFVYGGTLNILRRFGATIRGVATDEEGMLPEAIEAAIEQAHREQLPLKLIYTVPSYQNPQGWTMSLERRQALVEIAHRYGIPILEDDCYVDLNFDGERPVPSIYSLDERGSTLYVSSFSKIVAPGMRLGYMTGPRTFLERAMGAKSGGAVSTFLSWAVHRFATQNLHSHIEIINDIQREKRDAILGALEQHFSGTGSSWSKPRGGLFVWLCLPEGADVQSIRDEVLAQDDVGYLPGPVFAPDGESGKNCLRLCFGYNTPAEIRVGIERLAGAFAREGQIADRR